MKKFIDNNSDKIVKTNLLEIKNIDKNNLSKIIGQWLAVQQKEISKITKID